ncbi:UNVERIFIED_CONTAM: hypothetical protein HDU68_008744 [Siphonaria sp. JEL0065]|nr:hypothetical protein HDU68_008744 [Siphonaria sp. JEL0065]
MDLQEVEITPVAVGKDVVVQETSKKASPKPAAGATSNPLETARNAKTTQQRKRTMVIAAAGLALVIAGSLIGYFVWKSSGSTSPNSLNNNAPTNIDGFPTPSLTWGGNNQRNKVYPNSGVSLSGFGRRATVQLPLSYNINSTDSIYSQPIAFSVNGVEYAFIVTTGNNIYVVDGLNAKVKTAKNFGTPHDILNDPVFQAAQKLKDGDNYIGVCEDIVDYVGTVGTPVIDPSTNTAYFFSIAVKPAPDQFSRTMWFHAVDAITLEERPNFPIAIAPQAENNPFLVFDPNLTYQRPALLLENGIVYGTFGGHCDLAQGWAGWLIGVDTRTAKITTAWSAQGGSNNFGNGGGAIWMSGAGPALDEAGNLYLTTGTGLNPGSPEFYPTEAITKKNIPLLLNEAFVKFSLTSAGKATAMDFFMPTNLLKYDQADWDFGSGGPLILPPAFTGPQGQRLTIAIDKPGRVMVMDRDDLGGFENGPTSQNREAYISMFDLGHYVNTTQNVNVGYFNTPTLWTGDGPYLYISVKASELFALKWNPATSSFSLAGRSSFKFSPRAPGGFNTIPGMPVVTSNGNKAGSAVVWVTDVFNGLYGVKAVPDADGILQTVFHDPDTTNLISRFNIPGFSQTGSGLVYVPTNNGTLLIYGKV